MVSLAAQQLSKKLNKKKRAAAAPKKLSSPAAWQLSRKETTAQHLSRKEDRYWRTLPDSVSLVDNIGTHELLDWNLLKIDAGYSIADLQTSKVQ